MRTSSKRQGPVQLVLAGTGDLSGRPGVPDDSGPSRASVRREITTAEFFCRDWPGEGWSGASGHRRRLGKRPCAKKQAVYASNFDTCDYYLGDIKDVQGISLPSVDIATASFPCVDLSLAGHRRGLDGEHSGLFFEFARVQWRSHVGDPLGRHRRLLAHRARRLFSSSRSRDLTEWGSSSVDDATRVRSTSRRAGRVRLFGSHRCPSAFRLRRCGMRAFGGLAGPTRTGACGIGLRDQDRFLNIWFVPVASGCGGCCSAYC